MPQAIAAAIAYLGASAAVATTLGTIIFNVAVSVGISMLANAFLNRSPDKSPSERQFLNRSPVAPRERSYGRVRKAGTQMFAAAAGGMFYRVVAINHGFIDGFETHYLDDKPLTLDGSFYATDPEKYVDGSSKYVRVFTRSGSTTQTAHPALVAAIPDWDSTHQLLGIANVLTVFTQAEAEKMGAVFPRYESTAYTVLFRGARLLDFRTNTVGWSDNAALVLYDYLRHETGLMIPDELISPEIAAWEHAADVCDLDRTIRAGGTVKNYRIWGTYDYSERPADVLTRFLAACNGKIWPGPNGGLQLLVGEWVSPTVTIGGTAIIDYELAAGNEGPETFNVLSATYTEPDVAYVENSAEDWRLEDHIADFGELPTAADLTCVPNHNQCRRLMKQAAALLAPTWRGQLRTNLTALQALYERFVWIEIDELDDGTGNPLRFTAEIQNIQFDLDGADVKGLIIDFVSMDASAFSFNAASEEGVPSQTPPDLDPDAVPMPADFNVLIVSRSSAGAQYAVGVASWDPYTATGLKVELQYRRTGTASWLTVTSSTGAVSVETPQLQDGVSFEFRARTRATVAGDWTSTITRSVTVDTTAPGVPVSLTSSHIGTTVTVGWRHPSSANTYGSRIYRNTTNNSATATLIDTVYGGPNVVESFDDAGLASGTYWYWIATINGSGVESTRTLAGSETI